MKTRNFLKRMSLLAAAVLGTAGIFAFYAEFPGRWTTVLLLGALFLFFIFQNAIPYFLVRERDSFIANELRVLWLGLLGSLALFLGLREFFRLDLLPKVWAQFAGYFFLAWVLPWMWIQSIRAGRRIRDRYKEHARQKTSDQRLPPHLEKFSTKLGWMATLGMILFWTKIGVLFGLQIYFS